MRPNTRPAFDNHWARRATRSVAEKLVAAIESSGLAKSKTATLEDMRGKDKRTKKVDPPFEYLVKELKCSEHVARSMFTLVNHETTFPLDWLKDRTFQQVLISFRVLDAPTHPNRGKELFWDGKTVASLTGSSLIDIWFSNRVPIHYMLWAAKEYLAGYKSPFHQVEGFIAHEAAHAVDERRDESRSKGYFEKPTEVRAHMAEFATMFIGLARRVGLRKVPVSRQADVFDEMCKLTPEVEDQLNDFPPAKRSVILKGVWQALVDEGHFAST